MTDRELNATSAIHDRAMIFLNGKRMFLRDALAILIAEREQRKQPKATRHGNPYDLSSRAR